MAEPRPYVYQVIKVIRVVDGDTYWFRLDVGFRQWLTTEIRLLGYDTPERVGVSHYERAAAQDAKTFAMSWLDEHIDHLWVRTEKDPDHFGRWLGAVFAGDPPQLLGEALNERHLASVWPTRWHEEFGSAP